MVKLKVPGGDGVDGGVSGRAVSLIKWREFPFTQPPSPSTHLPLNVLVL